MNRQTTVIISKYVVNTTDEDFVCFLDKHTPTEVILEFICGTSIVCPQKDKSTWVLTFVYDLISNLFIFGQTIDVALIKL